ncbi:hypothetical protein [Ruegeria sp. HKCCA6707]|uniref:hypothetical protein n=1 Tax=Ruegeria sp. HKCCA6707 TaxID=2682996 RepID=UPI001488B64A|nr:hypothetical protein [Ruegeria sp. HKCCA6707]
MHQQAIGLERELEIRLSFPHRAQQLRQRATCTQMVFGQQAQHIRQSRQHIAKQ